MAASEVAPQPARVLIVDDSRMVRAAIAKHLKGRFTIVEAADGEEGWSRLTADAGIVAVITDLSMPGLDGYGLLTRIRSAGDAHLRDMPVLVISGDDESVQKKRAAKLGATDFITKGIAAVELVARLDNLAALRRAREAAESARETAAMEATTDPVTRQGSMALLVKQGASMFSYARRHRVPLSVVRVVIGDFPRIRAKVGEAVADQILTAVGKLLASRLRKEDVVARVDADEFAIAAPAAPAAAAERFARRLVDDIRAARITWQGRALRISACAGIADSTIEAAQSFADIYSAAGRRLERARAGEGDTVVASDPTEAGAAAVRVAPSVEEALALIATGRADELKPFVSELAIRIYPLAKFCDEQFSDSGRPRPESQKTQRMSTVGRPDVAVKTQKLATLGRDASAPTNRKKGKEG
jgi:diguanylate cyclase (GGDEF)-like protein